MSFRISPIAPPGSLLKGAKGALVEAAAAVGRMKREPKSKREHKSKPKRERDGKHLAAVRRCPCLSCDAEPAGEAAHLRLTIAGKVITGTGTKPGDRWALPLCHTCHMRQHAEGERPFWAALGLDPLAIATELYAASPDVGAMRAIAFKHREQRK